jgi:hypothetical protein
MSRWTAEITNDPEQDYALIIELLEGGEARGRIERNGQSELMLRVYGDDVRIPIDWLKGLIEQAHRDAAHI